MVRQAICIVVIALLVGVPTLQAGGCGFCSGMSCEINQGKTTTDCRSMARSGCHRSDISPSCSPCGVCTGNRMNAKTSTGKNNSDEIKSCRYRCDPDECGFLEIPSLIGDKPTPTSNQDVQVDRPVMEYLRDCTSLSTGERLSPINIHIMISSTMMRC